MIDIPTEMKKRPRRMPRNGSMSASSSWRKPESASISPARKAPIAIDMPANSMSAAAPSTTSSAAAVMISRGAGQREHAEERVQEIASGEEQRGERYRRS